MVLFGILLILSLTLETYSTNLVYGIYNDNYILCSIPISNSDSVISGEYLKINNQKYKYDIKQISELYAIENENYQDYLLATVNNEYKNNQVIKMTFYYQKEKIIKKIIKTIF